MFHLHDFIEEGIVWQLDMAIVFESQSPWFEPFYKIERGFQEHWQNHCWPHQAWTHWTHISSLCWYGCKYVIILILKKNILISNSLFKGRPWKLHEHPFMRLFCLLFYVYACLLKRPVYFWLLCPDIFCPFKWYFDYL